jgi:putative redox protein
MHFFTHCSTHRWTHEILPGKVLSSANLCALERAMRTATVKWVGDEEFLATMPSGQNVLFDAAHEHKKGPSPKEILLGALGACTAIDVVSILRKKRQDLRSLELSVSGEDAPDPPQVWTKIEIVYRMTGRLDEKAVHDAIELSETKYCSVAAMLGKAAKITYRYEIVPSD